MASDFLRSASAWSLNASSCLLKSAFFCASKSESFFWISASERPCFCRARLFRVKLGAHGGPQLILFFLDLGVHVRLEVLLLLVQIRKLALDLIDLLILFLELGVGFLLHLFDELAFRGDGGRVPPAAWVSPR